MFGKIVVPENLKKESVEVDRLGGDYKVLESGIYVAQIEHAYVTNSASSEAKGIHLRLKVNASAMGGSEEQTFNQTFWITNREGAPTYTNSKGEVKLLAGFQKMNAFFHLFLGMDITAYSFHKRTFKLYNPELKEEVPTEVDAIPELIEGYIGIAVQKLRVNKQEKDSNGVYQNTNEERFINEIDKFFLLGDDGKAYTLQEVQAKAEPEFSNAWAAKWTGKVVDKFKETAGATTVKSTVSNKKPANISIV